VLQPKCSPELQRKAGTENSLPPPNSVSDYALFSLSASESTRHRNLTEQLALAYKASGLEPSVLKQTADIFFGWTGILVGISTGMIPAAIGGASRMFSWATGQVRFSQFCDGIAKINPEMDELIKFDKARDNFGSMKHLHP